MIDARVMGGFRRPGALEDCPGVPIFVPIKRKQARETRTGQRPEPPDSPN